MTRAAAILVVALALGPVAARAGPAVDGAPPPRHQLGVLIGGSALLQVVYRLRALGPLHLEVGALGVTHGFNGSLSLLVEPLRGERWSGFAAAGVGFLSAFGTSPPTSCPPGELTCPEARETTLTGLVSVRFGAAYRFARRHRVALDVGMWRAVRRERREGVTTDREVQAYLIGGLAWLYAF